MLARLVPFLLLVSIGCAVSRPVPRTAPEPVIASSNTESIVLDRQLFSLSTHRVAELKSQGGSCAEYASILETSLQQGRVTMRPFMWRVGGKLVSGQASTDGVIVIARHIDSLNVGVRTTDDVIWSLEHEAAHLAFRIPNGTGNPDDGANAVVRGCRERSSGR